MSDTCENHKTENPEKTPGRFRQRLRFIKILPITCRVAFIFMVNILYAAVFPPKH